MEIRTCEDCGAEHLCRSEAEQAEQETRQSQAARARYEARAAARAEETASGG
jgi:hypothetical protein